MTNCLKNGGAAYILVLFVALLSFLAVRIYDKVDSMPDRYVEKRQYRSDQQRVEESLCTIQTDIKEILKALK